MTQSVPWISCKLTRSKPIKFITFQWSEFHYKISFWSDDTPPFISPFLTINKDFQKKPLANPLCWLGNPFVRPFLWQITFPIQIYDTNPMYYIRLFTKILMNRVPTYIVYTPLCECVIKNIWQPWKEQLWRIILCETLLIKLKQN